MAPRLVLRPLAILALAALSAQVLSSNDHHHQQRRLAEDRSEPKERALTATQWSHEFRCDLLDSPSIEYDPSAGVGLFRTPEEKLRYIRTKVPWYKRMWFSIMHECNRAQTAWRFIYIDELLDKFKILIKDSCTDERIANMIVSINTNVLIDLDYFKFNSGDAPSDRANELLVAGTQVNDAQCAGDLEEMARQMDDLTARLDQMRQQANTSSSSSVQLEPRHVRLARVLDSFGRYESGALSGHTRILGDYAQCLETSLERTPQGAAPIDMRYCWARMSLRKHINELLKRAHNVSDSVLVVGTCFPKSCHTKNINQHKWLAQKLINSQLVLPASIYVDQHLELESLFCLADTDGHFGMPLSGRIWCTFVAVWLLACIIITYFRLGESQLHEEANQIKEQHMNVMLDMKAASSRRVETKWSLTLGCFNLRQSWNDFTSDRRQPVSGDSIDLDVMNPVKIFACVFCVAAHSALMFASVSDNQVRIASLVERDFVIQAALIASVVVDTFFVISGLLLTYIIMKKLEAGFGLGNKRSRNAQLELAATGTGATSAAPASATGETANFLANWLVLAANRYLRLVPLYVFMFWFRRDVLTYLGSGPLWDYGFNRDTSNGGCSQESFLVPFTFLSAFTPLGTQCYVPSWSVSNDIFFGLVIPPFILWLRRKPQQALRWMVGLCVACSLGSIYAYSESAAQDRWELSEFRLHGVVKLFNSLSGVYTWPIYRVPSFFIGIIAGFALFHYDAHRYKQQEPRHAWPSWLTGQATRLAVCYLVLHIVMSMFLIEIKNLVYPYQRLMIAYTFTLDRALWSASNAVLFLRMVTDWRDGPWMRKFSSQKWRTLARLNYPTIFVHWIFIIIQTGIMTRLPSFSRWQLYASFASIYLMVLPCAIVLHVIFENPMDKLIKRRLFKL